MRIQRSANLSSRDNLLDRLPVLIGTMVNDQMFFLHLNFQNNKTELAVKRPPPETGSLGLARVGTRAALNFSFAFLKRAWRSGEDAELCSELLLDALEALQLLPEASLFNAVDISSLWLEVLENSIKFLRNVVIDDISEKFSIPQADRYIALSLLIELAIQKGTLSASLEAVILLLTLADKEKQCNDNRATKIVQSIGAPLLSILRRYENINCDQLCGEKRDTGEVSTSPTESFLRFLSLTDNEPGNIDLKKAAVVIISHLDRLVHPHLPNYECSPEVSTIEGRWLEVTIFSSRITWHLFNFR